MRGRLLVLALGACVAASASAQESAVIDLRGAHGPADRSFESLWLSAVRAAKAGDSQKAGEWIAALRRMRVERNVRGLEVVALAAAARGLERLEAGEAETAATDFALAIELAPQLPEGHLGLALAKVRQSPVNLPSAVRDVVAGLLARLTTSSGRASAAALLGLSCYVALLAVAVVFGVAMLLRHGGLLRHDLEEILGEGRAPVALGLFAALLLLPGLAFQGFGWLPLWWLALFFIYFSLSERVVAVLLLIGFLALGPVAVLAEGQLGAIVDAECRAALAIVEGSGDARAVVTIENAARDHPEDVQLAYLLAAGYKKAGRYEDAVEVYKQLVEKNPKDGLALTNWANLEFANAEFQSAIARYKAATEASEEAPIRATAYYNLHLAHLQRFEYQQAQEARTQADRLDRNLVQDYEGRWRVEKDGSVLLAVADLGLSSEECLAKYAKSADGAPARTGAGALIPGVLNRVSVAGLLFVVIIVLRRKLRGTKAFTMHCLKCGTPFCRRCHLGAAIGGLCTQCYHLFVVRDGVSGPARNQKLLEVQKEDVRREKVFRILSLLSPGAGHLYGQKTWSGLAFLVIWYALLALTIVAWRVVSLTEAPLRWVGPWPVVLTAVILLIVYILANRARPDFDVVIPVRRGQARPRAR